MISDEQGATPIRISRPEPFEQIPKTADGIYLVLHEPAAGGIIVVADATRTTTIDLEERLKMDGIKPSGPYDVPHSGTVNYPTRERSICSYFAVRDSGNLNPPVDVVAKKLEAAGIPREMIFSEDYSSARDRWDKFAMIASADYALTLHRLVSERARRIKERVLGEKRKQERASSLAEFYKTLAENTLGKAITMAYDIASNYAILFFAGTLKQVREHARMPFEAVEIGRISPRFGEIGYVVVQGRHAKQIAEALGIADRVFSAYYAKEGHHFSEPDRDKLALLVQEQVRTLYQRQRN